MVSSVAYKYARALAEVAGDMGQAQQVLTELRVFKDLLAEHPELFEILLNAALPFSARRQILERVAPAVPLERVTLNFLLVLLRAGRLKRYSDVLEAYELVLDERQGIVRGTVFSASGLDDLVRRRLEQTLAERTGKQVKLEHVRDDSLIGGLKLQLGSTVYDGSIRSQLDQIRGRLVSQS